MLILFPATLPKEFMISNCFWVEFWGSLWYRIMSSANRDSLTSSFPIQIPFISCSYLIVLARNSKTILNRTGESGLPCLFPDFNGNGFSCSLFSMMLALGCQIYPSLCWGSSILFLVSSELLSWKCVGFCQRFFFCIFWENHVVFVLASVYMLCKQIMDLYMLNHPCISGMELTWSWYEIFLTCWILFASILLRIFASIFIKDICL
jgi:hypothetical protein